MVAKKFRPVGVALTEEQYKKFVEIQAICGWSTSDMLRHLVISMKESDFPKKEILVETPPAVVLESS